MPAAWRLAKTKFANDPLSGDGARLYGGRWNSPGVSVVYLAGSISLAVLEVLVHLHDPRLLEAYSLIRVDFDASLVHKTNPEELPSSWADYPASPALQELGDTWVNSSQSLILQVPSAIVSLEDIFLLNPGHRDRAQLAVSDPVPFRLDPRLLK